MPSYFSLKSPSFPNFSMAVAHCYNDWIKIPIVCTMHDGHDLKHPLIWGTALYECEHSMYNGSENLNGSQCDINKWQWKVDERYSKESVHNEWMNESINGVF